MTALQQPLQRARLGIAQLAYSYGTREVELINPLCSRLSDSADMTPWEIIQESLVRKRPVRNMQWLAEQLDVKIQVVSNWKLRGVPAKRFRDIASALGITVDQLEGVTPLPWMSDEPAGLSPAVAQIAEAINSLPKAQQDWVLTVVRNTIDHAKQTMVLNGESRKNGKPDPVVEQPRQLRRKGQ